MKKTISLCLSLLLIMAPLTLLTSCSIFEGSISKSDIVGLWKCEYVSNGYKKIDLLEIRYDGTFTRLTGTPGIWEVFRVTGDYEIDGKNIHLYDDSSPVYHGISFEMSYSDGHILAPDGSPYEFCEGKQLDDYLQND